MDAWARRSGLTLHIESVLELETATFKLIIFDFIFDILRRQFSEVQVTMTTSAVFELITLIHGQQIFFILADT